MKITAWKIYWITRLDDVNGAACLVGVVSFVATLGLFITIGTAEGYGAEALRASCWPWVWRAISVVALCIIVGTFVPSTKEAVSMIVVPKMAENGDLQKLPANLLALANEWIEELKPKAKDSE